MGAHESTEVQVNFNRPSLFYFAGEQITGNISFQNTHDKLILDEIFLEFIGELGYATQETRHYLDSLGNLQPERHTEYHRIPFMNIRLSVVQPESTQREIILNYGQYSWPFKFTLPKRLPPSLLPTRVSHPYVKYYTRIVLDKPWYKPNAKQVYPLTIFPHVNLLHISGSQHIVPFSYLNRKKVQLNGYLQRAGIIPSEKLSIHINLQNPKQCIIKRVQALLIQHYQVAHSHHEQIIFQVDLPDLYEFNRTNFEQTFNFVVPSLHLAPSYKFMAPFNHQTHPVIIKYELELKVKVHGVLTDFEVKIPIIIGTELTLDQQQTNNFAEVPIANVSISDYDEPPPSYEAVVANETIFVNAIDCLVQIISRTHDGNYIIYPNGHELSGYLPNVGGLCASDGLSIETCIACGQFNGLDRVAKGNETVYSR